VKSCIITDTGDPAKYELEPGYILRDLPKGWIAQECAIVITVTDNTNTLEFRLDKFLSKSYRITGDKVRIGSELLQLNRLAITVGFKILLEDLDSMTDGKVE